MIGNLQVLRAVAALSVVFYHTGALLPGGIHTDLRGVAIFFVISGFIMPFIVEKDADRFFAHRLARIVPLYWLCTLALAAAVHRWALFRIWNWRAGFVEELASSLLFLPSQEHPFLGVGWTLNLEMYFYAVFAVALLASVRLAPLLAAAAVSAGLLLPAAGCTLAACNVYANGYMKFFVAGIGLYYVWRAAAPLLSSPLVGIACAMTLLGCYSVQVLSNDIWTNIIPVAIVAAALFLTSAGFDARWRPVLLLGDASYAIYLTHTIAMRFFPAAPPMDLASAAAIVATCALVGVCVHLLVEVPLNRRIRAALDLTARRGRCSLSSAPAAQSAIERASPGVTTLPLEKQDR